MSWFNKLKRYSGDRFGRPAIVGSRKINSVIRAYKRRNPPSLWKTMFGFGGGPTGRLRTKLGKRRAAMQPRTRRVRRRLIRRKGKRNQLYQTILKHGLTQEAIELDATSGSIARLGDNLTGVCQWYAFTMETTPAIFDRMLSASSNLAIGSVNTNQEIWLDNISTSLTFRVNCDADVTVQVFRCKPRIDIPIYAAGTTVTGANPQLLINGFNDTSIEAKATSAVGYTDQNATPFMSSEWCSLFKMKLVTTKHLKTGASMSLRWKRRLGFKVKKAIAGIGNTSSYAANYTHMRRNGPIYLVKVKGSVIHDESAVAYPLTSASNLKVTTGGFNVDWVKNSKIAYRAPFITPTRVNGTYGTIQQNILQANQRQYITELNGEPATNA